MSIGVDHLPSTSAWKCESYEGVINKYIHNISIKDYNQQVLFKEHLFDDKEWFVDISDGLDII